MLSSKKNLGRQGRKDIRIYSQLPMNYQVIFKDGRHNDPVSTLTVDISAGGALFESSEVLPVDASIKLTMAIPGIERNITAVSQVMRVEEIEFKRHYNIGVMFTDIKEEDRKELIRRVERLDIVRVLGEAVKHSASDVHFSCDLPPVMRVGERLVKMENMAALNREDMKNMIYSILSREQINIFEKTKELDLAINPTPDLRFRVNVHQQMGNVEAAFRAIPKEADSIEALTLPNIAKDFASLKKGIVIIGGPTNSGKTTTLSAMTEFINNTREAMIISLERPVEFIHKNKKSIIKQREIGIDACSFAAAFQSTLRQDPDVVVVGEMSDKETIQTAIIAAETGHLVLSSLHAPDSAQLFDRIIGAFPADQHRQIAQQLSRCFAGAITQLLLPAKTGAGRVLATEVIVATDAVRHIIREMNFSHLNTIIQTGAKYGMYLMEDNIKSLCDKEFISIETYMSYVKKQ